MATALTPTLALLLLLLLLLAPALHGSDASDKLIASTCQRTKRAGFCTSVLYPDRRSLNATTVDDLATLSVLITQSVAYDTLTNITDLASKNPGTALEGELKQCAESYVVALDSLTDVLDDLSTKTYESAWEYMGSTATAPDHCEAVFGDDPMPIAERNNSVKDHIALSVDLISLLVSWK